MSTPDPLSAEMVGQLAAHGGVPLGSERAQVVAEFMELIAPDLARVMAADVDGPPAVMFHVEQAGAGFAHPLPAKGR
jgi:hypothetical protein